VRHHNSVNLRDLKHSLPGLPRQRLHSIKRAGPRCSRTQGSSFPDWREDCGPGQTKRNYRHAERLGSKPCMHRRCVWLVVPKRRLLRAPPFERLSHQGSLSHFSARRPPSLQPAKLSGAPSPREWTHPLALAAIPQQLPRRGQEWDLLASGPRGAAPRPEKASQRSECCGRSRRRGRGHFARSPGFDVQKTRWSPCPAPLGEFAFSTN